MDILCEPDRELVPRQRDILASAVKPEARLLMGDALAALGREIGLTEGDFEALEQARRQAGAAMPAQPLRLD